MLEKPYKAIMSGGGGQNMYLRGIIQYFKIKKSEKF